MLMDAVLQILYKDLIRCKYKLSHGVVYLCWGCDKSWDRSGDFSYYGRCAKFVKYFIR